MQNTKRLIPLKVKTRLDEMNLLDRFLFNETVEDPAIYNAMVEILMEQKITMVDWTETEKELRVSPELRQVRLDVIGIDEVGELYQVEMQEENTYNIPKRSRYYQAQIDVSLLEPGCGDFNKLNDLTTILVAPFDLFGYGLYRYTFEEYCEEVPELKLQDGAKRIFINTKGNNPEKFSKEFLEFMEYINESTENVAKKSESERIRRIHARVQNVKDSEKVGVKLMQAWEERYYDRLAGREEGLAEGHSIGLAEGRILNIVQLVCKKLRKSYYAEQIAEDLEEEIAMIYEICRVAEAFAPGYDEKKIWEKYRETCFENKVMMQK